MTDIKQRQQELADLEKRRQEEMQLYRDAYAESNYGMGKRRQEDVQRILADIARVYPGDRSLLDLGTGRGETCRFALEAGFAPVRGLEQVPELTGLFDGPGGLYEVQRWQADQPIPAEDGKIGHVTCFDVVEHLLEPDIHNLIREGWRVTRCTMTVSASERPSELGPGGRDLHISKRPAAAWQALFEGLTGVCWRQIGMAGGSPCFQAVKGAS